MNMVRRRITASLHELQCRECRVSWRSWLRRLTTRERCSTCGDHMNTPGCCKTPNGGSAHTITGGHPQVNP